MSNYNMSYHVGNGNSTATMETATVYLMNSTPDLNGSMESNRTMTTPQLVSSVSLNYDLPAMIIVAAILFVVIVATAFGNFLVGLALFKFRYLRTISNYLIGNLALSDFLLATTILPMSTVNQCLGHWVFGRVMCNFWLITDVLYCTASIWNLCIIAFDRFTATLFPLWYREKRSNMQAAIYVAFVWVISIAICIPPLLGWNDLSQNYVYDNTTNVYKCVLFQTESYVLYSASGSFYIPFLITFFLYVSIFIVLRERMIKMRQASKARQERLTARKETNEKASSPPTVIEMTSSSAKTTAALTVVTEEMSSKSFFASDSGDKSSDDDDSLEDDSSSQINRHSQKDPAGKPNRKTDSSILKNGLKSGNPSARPTAENTAMLEPRPYNSDMEVEVKTLDNSSEQPSSSANASTQTGKTAVISDSKPAVTLIQPLSNNNKIGQKFLNLNPFSKEQKKKKVRRSQKRKFEQREMRATIRMAIIIAVFCGMWLGFFTIYVIASLCKHCSIPQEVDAFFFWLGYSNSSINPILYTIFNEEFRRAFQKLLGCYHKSRRGMGRR